MTAEQIAAELSQPMRKAVLDLCPFFGLRHSVYQWEGPYKGHSAGTLNALHRRGLTWGKENYRSRWVALLPLGVEVQAILRAQS